MVTKDELRQQVNTLQSTVSSLKVQLRETESKATDNIIKAQTTGFSDAMVQMYDNWKSLNEVFLERYMQEYISNNLTVEMKTDYYGYVSVKLKLNGKEFSETHDSVNIHRNTLDD